METFSPSESSITLNKLRATAVAAAAGYLSLDASFVSENSGGKRVYSAASKKNSYLWPGGMGL